MTNKEFYSDMLLAAALVRDDGCKFVHELKHRKACYGKVCYDCKLYTIEGMREWLNAEHVEPEPPLLENGAGLEPGDWIMVRDNDGYKWEKCQFLCYLDGEFYVRKDCKFNDCYSFSRRKQARLPEDGE